MLLQDNRELIASALEPVEFRAGQSIFQQGERGERFYIVQEGAVTVSKTSNGERTMLAKLGEGAYFGERALIKDDVRHVSHWSCTVCTASDNTYHTGVPRECLASMQHANLLVSCATLCEACGSALS